jgi:hypothetical protein
VGSGACLGFYAERPKKSSFRPHQGVERRPRLPLPQQAYTKLRRSEHTRGSTSGARHDCVELPDHFELHAAKLWARGNNDSSDHRPKPRDNFSGSLRRRERHFQRIHLAPIPLIETGCRAIACGNASMLARSQASQGCFRSRQSRYESSQDKFVAT